MKELLLLKKKSIHAFNGVPPNHAVTEVYKGEGLISTDTLKLTNGLPTFLSQRGVVQMVQKDAGHELLLISEDINGVKGLKDGLISETDAVKAATFAIDFDNKYWLFLDDYVFILQYDLIHQGANKVIYPWVKWGTITAYSAAVKDNYLYYGGAGNVYKFDPAISSDNGTAITSYWLSKKFNMDDTYEWMKWFLYMWLDFKVSSALNSIDIIVYIDDTAISLQTSTFSVNLFNPNNFNPNQFNPNSELISVSFRIPIHKKGKFIQFKVSCDDINNTFNLLSSKMEFTLDRKWY